MTKGTFKKALQLQHDIEVMDRMEYIIDDTVETLNNLKEYTSFQYDKDDSKEMLDKINHTVKDLKGYSSLQHFEDNPKELLNEIENCSKAIGELFEALIHDCPNVGVSMTAEVLEHLKTLTLKQKETMTEDFKQL